MNPIPCFLLEATDQYEVVLRRFDPFREGEPDRKCPCGSYPWRFYHDVSVPVRRVTAASSEAAFDQVGDAPPPEDPRWPAACPCGYVFRADDHRQITYWQLFRRQDTGELLPLEAAPVGAMWNASWYLEHRDPAKCGNEFRGPDGQCLVVRIPGERGGTHDWCIDGRASNCTMPGDNIHKCWVRAGAPPKVTAGKGGHTCAAGAGSIAVPGYHGFLIDGELRSC